MQYAPGHQQLGGGLLIRQHPHHAPGVGILQYVAQQHGDVLRLSLADLRENAQCAVGGRVGGNAGVEHGQPHIEQALLPRRLLHLQRHPAHRRHLRLRIQAGQRRLLGPGRSQQQHQPGGEQQPRYCFSVVHTRPREIVILQL